MENTEYLYHYTSIENLALILKNRTIRLNPLDKMDDLQEQKTADVKNLGKFVFVSCWTDDSAESIPMWKMYTNPLSGVRIRLRKNPFVRHRTGKQDVEKARKKGLFIETDLDGTADTFVNIGDEIDKNYYCIESYYRSILRPVEYTDDPSKLEPRVFHDDGITSQLSLSELGKNKNKHWAFQKEWRYRMSFIKMQYLTDIKEAEKMAIATMKRMVQGIEDAPFSYYDLDIDPLFFSGMEITCSPQMSAGNRVILEALVEKYNPTAKILDSDLLGKI